MAAAAAAAAVLLRPPRLEAEQEEGKKDDGTHQACVAMDGWTDGWWVFPGPSRMSLQQQLCGCFYFVLSVFSCRRGREQQIGVGNRKFRLLISLFNLKNFIAILICKAN